ncbi:hypothetical protein ACSSS7_001577 [Eimeria intestinalis]
MAFPPALPVNCPEDLASNLRLGRQTLTPSAAEDATLSDGTLVFPHTTRISDSRLEALRMHRDGVKTGQGSAALAVFASVMAILFTMLLCRYPRYLMAEPLTADRKLSTGDSSDEANVAWCAEAQFESGYSASGESEDGSAPQPKVASWIFLWRAWRGV